MLLHALIPPAVLMGQACSLVFFQGCKWAVLVAGIRRRHPFHGAEIKADAVAQEVVRAREEHTLEGITFSGGEPMQQADSLLRSI